MTVADDLATLRGFFDPTLGHDDPFRQALARVEAEIARLTLPNITRDQMPALFTAMRERAEAAEAEVARLRDGLLMIQMKPYRTDEVARSLLAEDGAT